MLYKSTHSDSASDTTYRTDEELVLAAKLADKAAFTELWNRHSATVYRLIYRILRNHEDVEDALQESFLKAFRHIGGFHGDAKFSTWMTRIAFNTAFGELRDRRSRPSSPLEWMSDDETRHDLDIRDKSIDIEKAYERLEELRRLRMAIERLRPEQRKLVKLKLFHECPDKEISMLTDMSLPSVKSHLRRARKALRSMCNY